MRLDTQEKEALRFALKDFRGKAYLFGSRLDNTKKGGIRFFWSVLPIIYEGNL